MDFNTFYKELAASTLRPIYHFSGNEVYLIDHSIKYIEEQFLAPAFSSFNFHKFEGSVDIDHMIQTALTLPFMDVRRVILLSKTGILKTIKDDQEEKLIHFLKTIPDFTHLIFYENDTDGRKKLPKWLKANAQPVVFSPLSSSELSKWIQKRLKLYGITMTPSVLSHFIERLDYLSEDAQRNLYDVDNYLKSFATISEPLGVQHINQYIEIPIEHNVFKMIDAIHSGNHSEAIQMLNAIIGGGEPEIKLFALIAQQYRTLYKMKLLLASGYTATTAASKIDVHPFVAKKASSIVPKFSQQSLLNILSILDETDALLKSTGLPAKWMLEKALLSISLEHASKKNV